MLVKLQILFVATFLSVTFGLPVDTLSGNVTASSSFLDDNIHLHTFQASEYSKFNSGQIKELIKRGGRSSLTFGDSDSVLVVDATDADNVEVYEVVIGETYHEPVAVLIPATSCLKFPNGKGSGGITVGHSVGVSLSQSLGGSISFPIGIALGISASVKVGQSGSFSSLYTCETSDGADVRVFYRILTTTTAGRMRRYSPDGNTFHHDNWMNFGPVRFLLDLMPQYFCGTADRMDLGCEETSVKVVFENGQQLMAGLQ